jgi:hypothetical protein
MPDALFSLISHEPPSYTILPPYLISRRSPAAADKGGATVTADATIFFSSAK